MDKKKRNREPEEEKSKKKSKPSSPEVEKSESNQSSEIDDAGEDKKSPKGIEIGRDRYVSVSEFKGKVLVDIREFFMGKDGTYLPGRKGISLKVEEWKKLVANIEKINKKIAAISGEDTE